MFTKTVMSALAIIVVAGISTALYFRLQQSISLNDRFIPEIIDRKPATDPWGKNFGDVNNDGVMDLIVGSYYGQQLVAYTGPNFEPETIATGHYFSTDHEVGDVNGDGKNDIVSLANKELIIFYGDTWQEDLIDQTKLHDLELTDLDQDGDIDIVARNQSAFKNPSDKVHIYENLGQAGWNHTSKPVIEGEGLTLADFNDDGRTDIVLNKVWLENPGHTDINGWSIHTYGHNWDWLHTKVAVGDLDGDGVEDIVLAPSELANDLYRISWFKASQDVREPWTEHVIEKNLEAVHHSLQIADINRDGFLDVITAKMHAGKDPDNVVVYFNHGKARAFTRHVLDTHGTHSIKAGDFDNDGDPDLFGANHTGPDQAVRLWRNGYCPPDGKQWERIVVDEDQRWTSVFVLAGDIDNDGWSDIVAGAWWYRNPGFVDTHWQRHRFSKSPFNAAYLLNADGDNDIDVLGTAGEGKSPSGKIRLALNDANGNFKNKELTEVQGDFLQGVAVIPGQSDHRVVLSWHASNTAMHSFYLTHDLRVSEVTELVSSQETLFEDLEIADLNMDGVDDIVMGTKFLASTNGTFELNRIANSEFPPDRNAVADFDQDGLPDIAIGYEAVSKIGPIAWYRNPGNTEQVWKETVVDNIIGPLSLDAGDIDRDGDIDLVAGEHNLVEPETARLIFFENVDSRGDQWQSHVIHTGDEHHDGAQLVDIDNDGDLDVLSIGWGHQRLLLYKNLIGQCGPEFIK